MNLVVWALPIWIRLASSHVDCFSFPHCLYDLKLSCVWGKLLAMFHIFYLQYCACLFQVFQDPNHWKNNTYNTFFFWTLVTLIQAPVHFVYIVVRIVTICACSILEYFQSMYGVGMFAIWRNKRLLKNTYFFNMTWSWNGTVLPN